MEAFDPQSGAVSQPPNQSSTGALSRLLPFATSIIFLIAGAYYLNQRSRSHPAQPPLLSSISTATPRSTPQPSLMVHIVGRIARPGVYRLPFNSRVIDAIHKAGGPLPDADTDALNLAAWIEDGTRIEVPPKAKLMPGSTEFASNSDNEPDGESNDSAEERTFRQENTSRSHNNAPARSTPLTSRVSLRASTSRARSSSRRKEEHYPPDDIQQHPINLNTATAAQLESLPGIGPVTAARIIAYREENGKFVTVDDLDEVKGIGEKKLEKIRPLVTVK